VPPLVGKDAIGEALARVVEVWTVTSNDTV
jgi:hypothetical protein